MSILLELTKKFGCVMKKKRILIIIATIIAISSIAIIIKNSMSYNAFILLNNGNYVYGKNIIIINNSIKGDISKQKSRSLLFLKKRIDKEMNFSYKSILLENVKRIEFNKKIKDIIVPKRMLGLYKISASGHRGFLKIWKYKGRLYGSIRFPNWAKGVTEYLKGVHIKNNKLFFVRSITTSKELRRIGATSYFSQSYYGTYSNTGNFIKGFYVKKGAKFLWEATR